MYIYRERERYSFDSGSNYSPHMRFMFCWLARNIDGSSCAVKWMSLPCQGTQLSLSLSISLSLSHSISLSLSISLPLSLCLCLSWSKPRVLILISSPFCQPKAHGCTWTRTLGLRIAQSRFYVHALGPKACSVRLLWSTGSSPFKCHNCTHQALVTTILG